MRRPFQFIARPINKLLLALLLVASALVLLLQQSTMRLSALAPLQIALSNETGMTLVLNGHAGTALDWNRIATSTVLNLTSYSELSPRLFTPYGQSGAEADFLSKTIGKSICETFNHVVVIDTNPDARFLLKMMVDGNCREDMRVLMISTNRFDYDVIDRWDYHNLIRKVAKTLPTRVLWVANNPWESQYAIQRLGGVFLDYHMIRPFGYSSLPAPPAPPPAVAKLPVLFQYSNTVHFASVLSSAGIPFHHLPKHYGGPAALRQYRAVLMIPYQASTMKMYENIAHGVVMLVPSPRLLGFLISGPGYELSAAGKTFDVAGGVAGYKYIECYNDDLKDFFYTFDSLADLKRILASDVIDTRNVRKNGPVYWEGVRERGRSDWRRVFAEFYPDGAM